MRTASRSTGLRYSFTPRQRAAILRTAKAAETVVIPTGRPRDAVSAYTYAPHDDCWFSGMGPISDHACHVATRLIEMQLSRQVRESRA
jgi:hypothetical protein